MGPAKGLQVLFLYLYNGHRAKLPTAEVVSYRNGEVLFSDGSETSIAEFRREDILIFSHQDLGPELTDLQRFREDDKGDR